MLKNDRINLIIALLIALSLWVYVLLEENPFTKENIKNVPVNYMHAESLEEDGLVVLQKETQSISISFSGQRSYTDKITPADFKVSADLEGLKEGDNTVRINVTGPEDVTIETYSPQKAKVHVDRLISEEKPVQVLIANQSSDDSEPHIVQVSKDAVHVKGAETLVNKVTGLRATVDASKVGDTMKALNTDLVPVDKDGNEVFGVVLEKDKVSVTAVLHKTKTVSLLVPVTGNDNFFITRDVSAPKSITLKGTEENLADVTSVECEPVDVSRVYENMSVDLVPKIPENLEVTMESQHLRAHITVTGASTAEYTFDETDIVLEGAGLELVSDIEDVEVVVKISGNSDVVEGMNEHHFSLYADIYGLGVGEHMVPLTVICTNNMLELEYNPTEIKIVIEEKSGATGGYPDESQEVQPDGSAEQEGQGEF